MTSTTAIGTFVPYPTGTQAGDTMSDTAPKESAVERRARLGRAAMGELETVATRFYRVRKRVNAELDEFEQVINRALANATSELDEGGNDAVDHRE